MVDLAYDIHESLLFLKEGTKSEVKNLFPPQDDLFWQKQVTTYRYNATH